MPSSSPKLSRGALTVRFTHAAIATWFLLAIVYVWWCALTGRRGALLHFAVTALVIEGVLVAANGGDCPLGGLQERVGDPVPLFEAQHYHLPVHRDCQRHVIASAAAQSTKLIETGVGNTEPDTPRA